MKVLVFGPGMIGTLLAAKLSLAGHEVTVLGRGRRLAQIRERGLRIRSTRTGVEERGTCQTVEALGDEAYDWILVTVRGDQVEGALPALKRHDASRNVMIMANHAGDLDAWIEAVGAERLALGFPGLGASFDDEGVLDYQLAPRAFQPTTLGEIDGRDSPRIADLSAALEAAGVPAARNANMVVWLRYHVAWISVMGLMSAASGQSVERLIADASIRERGVDAIREGFRVLSALGYPMTPGALRVFTWTPRWALAFALKKAVADPSVRRVIEHPTEGMRSEGRHMVAQMRALSEKAGVPMPAYEVLAAHYEMDDA